MRNPGRARNVSATVLTLSALTAAATLTFIRPNPETQSGWFGVEVVACLVALTSLFTTLYFQVAHARRERLKRGVGVLAKWTVSRAELLAYLEREALRGEEWPRNAIKLGAERAATGVEVLFGQGAILVDGDFQSLTDVQGIRWLTSRPKCVECNMSTRGKSGSISWTLRFPVATEAEPQARAACEKISTARRVPFTEVADASSATS